MDVNKAYELATGLRGLAEFIGDNAPLLPDNLDIEASSWLWSWNNTESTPKEEIAAVIRAALGNEDCTITKEYSDYAFRLALEFSPEVTYKVKTQRDEVCTATVVGTEEYEVPITVGHETKTRDIVEWSCDPLLDRLVDEKSAG